MDLTLVFTFANNPQVGGNILQGLPHAVLVAGTAHINSPTVSGMQCFVTLTNVTNSQTLVVSLEGVHGSKDYINVTVPITLLIGDVTRNSSVNASDVAQVKTSVGSDVNQGNFYNDVTLNGSINASDVSLVKKSGTATDYTPPPSLARLEVCGGADSKFLCQHGAGKFFWLGDTCWWLMNASDEDVLTYLSRRVAQGFNGIQIMALMLELPNIVEPGLQPRGLFSVVSFARSLQGI